LLHECRRVEELMSEVARVEIDPEVGAPVDCSERLSSRDEVVRDLCWMDLEPEAHPFALEDVYDRPPAFGEVLVTAFDLVEVVRWEGVERVPDARAGEAVDLLDAERGGGARGLLHSLGRSPADALGIADAPDLGSKDRPVAFVDAIADALADEV